MMSERARRMWAAAEARAIGWGGVSQVARATGMARNTIASGLRELQRRGRPRPWERERVRRLGGGRKRLTDHQPEWLARLEALIEPTVRGDPQSALRWTTWGVRTLEGGAEEGRGERQLPHGCESPEEAQLYASGSFQTFGRQGGSPRPGRPVSLYQRSGGGCAARSPTRDLGGHEK